MQTNLEEEAELCRTFFKNPNIKKVPAACSRQDGQNGSVLFITKNLLPKFTLLFGSLRNAVLGFMKVPSWRHLVDEHYQTTIEDLRAKHAKQLVNERKLGAQEVLAKAQEIFNNQGVLVQEGIGLSHVKYEMLRTILSRESEDETRKRYEQQGNLV